MFVSESRSCTSGSDLSLQYSVSSCLTPPRVDNFEPFIEKFLAGELEAYLKSEPVPVNNDGPVKVSGKHRSGGTERHVGAEMKGCCEMPA